MSLSSRLFPPLPVPLAEFVHPKLSKTAPEDKLWRRTCGHKKGTKGGYR